MPVNHYFQSGLNLNNANEQTLLESMIIECIQIKGFEMLYLPRQTENLNMVLGEDPSSYFTQAIACEMFLENVDGFGGMDENLASKFGIELRQTATFTVARRRWEEATAGATLQLPNRPAEGDLLYFKKTGSVFEIRRVEHDNPFYQLGKLYVYRLNCELYQYSHEVFNTGDLDIDSINMRNTDKLENIVLNETGGAFVCENGDLVVQDNFNMKSIEPLSDNEELTKDAIELVNWASNDPFSEVVSRTAYGIS